MRERPDKFLPNSGKGVTTLPAPLHKSDASASPPPPRAGGLGSLSSSVHGEISVLLVLLMCRDQLVDAFELPRPPVAWGVRRERCEWVIVRLGTPNGRGGLLSPGPILPINHFRKILQESAEHAHRHHSPLPRNGDGRDPPTPTTHMMLYRNWRWS